MPIEIAPITEEMIPSFHAALDAVARERRYIAALQAPPLARTREFVLATIARGHPQFAALDGDVVAGWCDVTPDTRDVHAHVGILGMGVLPAYRGRGIGTLLIRRTLDAAWALGLTRVELSVRDDNPAAIALYRKIGFEVEGTKRNAVRVDHTHHDLIIMALLFSSG